MNTILNSKRIFAILAAAIVMVTQVAAFAHSTVTYVA